MSVTYLGQLSAADLLPAVARFVAAVNTAIAAVNAEANVLLTAKAAIRVAAIGDLQVQLAASLAASVAITGVDPAAYLAGILSGVAQITVNIGALVPELALSAQLAASVALTAQLTAKIAAFDLVLAALGDVAVALSAAVNIAPIALAFSARVYAVNSTVGAIGGELSAAFAGGLPGVNLTSEPIQSLLVVTESAADWAGLSVVAKVST